MNESTRLRLSSPDGVEGPRGSRWAAVLALALIGAGSRFLSRLQPSAVPVA